MGGWKDSSGLKANPQGPCWSYIAEQRMPLLTDAGRVVLSEAWGAFAVESSDNVHTEELAVVLLGGTFIQV